MVHIGNLNEGIKISFETRGVTDEIMDFLWEQLSPSKLKNWTEQTGHNLLVFNMNNRKVCVYIEVGETKYLRQKIYTVRCGIGDLDEDRVLI